MTATEDDDAVIDDTTIPAKPTLRILKGNPSDEDVATIVALLAGATVSADSTARGPRDLWGTPTDRLRPAQPLSPLTFINVRFGH